MLVLERRFGEPRPRIERFIVEENPAHPIDAIGAEGRWESERVVPLDSLPGDIRETLLILAQSNQGWVEWLR
jgi:hypothetical protein